MSIYLATFFSVGYVTGLVYVSLLIAAATATAFTNLLLDRGEWRIGLFVAPPLASRDFAFGALFAITLVACGDLLVIASTSLHHARADGFPWRDLMIVYVPASLHEELLFRGYIFQKARAWNRQIAIAASALVFGALHTINSGITSVAIVNLIIAGVMLALAYELFERLWFPIGLHLAWNLATGPVLGYGVSGYSSETTMFVTSGTGPPSAPKASARRSSSIFGTGTPAGISTALSAGMLFCSTMLARSPRCSQPTVRPLRLIGIAVLK